MKPRTKLISATFTWAFLLFTALGVWAAEEQNYLIGSGDQLDISVWGQPDLQRRAEVSQDGAITFPPVGQLQAGGRTAFELEKEIRARLSAGFLVNPQVTVTVSTFKSQKVFILGEVRKPGSYVLTTVTTLPHLLAEAGGLTEKADTVVTIVRQTDNQENAGATAAAGQDEAINYDLRQLTSGQTGRPFVLTAGDTVYVPEARRFFVTGEVKKTGEFKWEDGLTIRQAVSMAGGPSDRGAPNRTTITRTVDGVEQTIRPNMNDQVLPDDIVEVPLSYF